MPEERDHNARVYLMSVKLIQRSKTSSHKMKRLQIYNATCNKLSIRHRIIANKRLRNVSGGAQRKISCVREKQNYRKLFSPLCVHFPTVDFIARLAFGHSFDTGAQQEIEWKMQANFSAHRRRPSSLTNNDKEGSLLSFFCNNAFGIKLAS